MTISAEQKLIQSLNIPVVKKNIKIGDHLINYIECGSGEPLVLVHGANIGWGQWHKNIPELSKYFKIYSIDLVSAGGSSKIDFQNLNLEHDLVDVVDQFITSKSLNRVNLLGHSLGGWIALKIVLR